MMIREQEIYVLETNTIPGMTATSLFPQGAKAAGIDSPGPPGHPDHPGPGERIVASGQWSVVSGQWSENIETVGCARRTIEYQFAIKTSGTGVSTQGRKNPLYPPLSKGDLVFRASPAATTITF